MASPHALVSIVIPCYASSSQQLTLLNETLQTVAAQSHPAYEVIVVDDGSPADVAAVANGYPSTTTIRQDNTGCALARNTGISRSTGDYFVFLDSDDYLLGDALESQLAALQAHPDAGYALGQREEMTFDGEPVPWSIPPLSSQPWLYETLLGFDWYVIPPSSAMFRRDVVLDVGGFQDPWGADDLDFYLRVAWRYRACFNRSRVTRYRRYSASSSRDGERMLNSMRAVYARQLPLVQGHAGMEAAYRRGLALLTRIFVDCLVENIADRARAGQWDRAARAAEVLARESPERLAEVAEFVDRLR